MAPREHDFLWKMVPGNQGWAHTMVGGGTLTHQKTAHGEGEAGPGITAQYWPVGTMSPGLEAPPSLATPLPRQP